MNGIKYLAMAALAVAFVAAGTQKAEAQLNVSIGVAPSCPYGYYDYTPYQLRTLRVLRSGVVPWARVHRRGALVSWLE